MATIREILEDSLNKLMPVLELLEKKNELLISTAKVDNKDGTVTFTIAMKSKGKWKHFHVAITSGKGLPKGLR